MRVQCTSITEVDGVPGKAVQARIHRPSGWSILTSYWITSRSIENKITANDLKHSVTSQNLIPIVQAPLLSDLTSISGANTKKELGCLTQHDVLVRQKSVSPNNGCCWAFFCLLCSSPAGTGTGTDTANSVFPIHLYCCQTRCPLKPESRSCSSVPGTAWLFLLFISPLCLR